jgi:drug/metabolite transporter (DMT)-like permease
MVQLQAFEYTFPDCSGSCFGYPTYARAVATPAETSSRAGSATLTDTAVDRDRHALILGLSAVFFWSTAATAFKIALRHMDVYQLLFYASLVSALSLLAVVLYRRQGALLITYLRQTPVYFIGVALLNPFIYYQVLLTAYDLLPAQQAQAINYTWAITLALMAVPLLGQRLHGRDIFAALVGYAGVLVIATRGDVLGLRFDSVRGVTLALLSTVIWAYYWIISTRNQRDAVVSLCLNFMLAVPLCALMCHLLSSLQLPDWQGMAAAGYVGVFEMGVTFMLWSAALKSARRVARISNLIFLSPFVSLVFIQTILGESVHPATLVGLCMIVPAALLQQMQGSRQES